MLIQQSWGKPLKQEKFVVINIEIRVNDCNYWYKMVIIDNHLFSPFQVFQGCDLSRAEVSVVVFWLFI